MTKIIPICSVMLAIGLSACSDSETADLLRGNTEKTITVHLDYNDVARTTEEAQAEVRERCGEAEVVSVSQPTVLENGLFRVTAECQATHDRKGNLILE